MAYNKGIFKDHDEVWVEKYRPRTFDDLIIDKELKEKLLSYIKKQDMPNLIFEGPSGTGKSSIANLLIKGIDCDFKEINAASDNGIDTARTIINDFCATSSFSPIKVMVLSEFSEFTPQGQGALRDVMEKASEKTRFLMTCNSIERVIPPILSRLQSWKIIPPSKAKVYERMAFILKNENVDYDKEEMEKIVDFSYPDVRKCIQSLEQQVVDGVLKLNKDFFRLLQYQDTVIEIAKTIKPGISPESLYTKTKEVRQALADSRVKNFGQLYRYMFDKLDDYAPANKAVKVIFDIEEGLKHDYLIADKEINVIATVLKVFETLSEK